MNIYIYILYYIIYILYYIILYIYILYYIYIYYIILIYILYYIIYIYVGITYNNYMIRYENTRWLKVETGISSSPVHSPVFTRSRWDKPSPSTARSGRLMIDPPMSSRTSRLFFAPIVGL